jgi:cellulose biosynthesis protein BcsQ
MKASASMSDPTVIVVGNEKGGAGKSTLAIHIVTGLLHAGKRVAIMDLDLRQRSLSHFFANSRRLVRRQPAAPADADGA